MYYLVILLKKELLLLKNSYFRTSAQIAGFFGRIAFIGAVAGLLTWLVHRGMLALFEEIPPEATGDLASSIVLLVYSFLGSIVLFSVIEESRKRFFLTPDMSLLMATPTNPSVILIVRFVMFISTNFTMLLQFAIFGLPLLISLGMLLEASWLYYFLLFPITYLYLAVPAALGIILIMLLIRLFSPRQLFRIASALTIAVVMVWVNLIIVYQDFAERAINWLAGTPLYDILLPLRAVSDVVVGLAGPGINHLFSVPVLLASVPITIGLMVIIIRRVYYLNYEKLQLAERFPTKAKTAKSFDLFFGSSQTGVLVSHHLKMAFRNKEMAPGAFFMMILPVIYV
ncbi:MAG TPA: hypothetical protein VLH15_07370, partial [Dehalococcoidales bacterium]|nr:hypothetical protein [Dehalococcoidales bacterium]